MFRTKRFDLSDKIKSPWSRNRAEPRDYDRMFLWIVAILGAALILFALANREAKSPLPKRSATSSVRSFASAHSEMSRTGYGGNK